MCKVCPFCGEMPKVYESAVEIEIFCCCFAAPYVTNSGVMGANKKEVRIGWNYLSVHRQPYLLTFTQLEGSYKLAPKGKYVKLNCPSCKDDERNYKLKYISGQGIYGCELCDSLFLSTDVN